MLKNESKKILSIINKNYKFYLRKVIQSNLYSDINLPIEWEDIYSAFLLEISKEEKIINHPVDSFFKTYLGNRCRWFTKNYQRKFNTNKHKIMNYSVTLKEEYNSFNDGYKIQQEIKIDLAKLNNKEIQVYKAIFLDKLNFIEASKNLKISYYKIKKHLKAIKLKLF